MKSNWVAPFAVIEALARCHEQSGRFADLEVCIRVAEETVMARLVAGLLPTLASYVHQNAFEGFEVELRDEAVPVSFWRDWECARPIERDADWVVGDFRHCHGDDWTSGECWGKVFGVKIDASSFPNIGLATQQELEVGTAQRGKGGRSRHQEWPSFMAELTWHISVNGAPAGVNGDGQADIYKAVADRLADRGIEAPSIETVKTTLSAVLGRFRSGEN